MLRDALAAARDGRFTAVFLAGESGVGKSRLVEELATEAEESGARVLVGECVALADGELPYGPIRAALRPLDAELEALTVPGREELARLLPQLGAPGAPAPGRSATGERLAQGRLFELVLAVLSRLGDEQPVMLAVEDIHWADRSTLDFLAFLMANARGERLALVCTYRVDALHRSHPLRPFLAQNERRPSVERVELPRFTEPEVRAQIAAILGAEADDALARRLYARTEGNPFFTEELLAAAGGEQELPGSLRDALMLHVDSLSDTTQQVLRTAAVHGRVVTHRLIAATTDLQDVELHAALREAVAHHVLVRRDLETFAFRHALLLEALAADLLPGERESFHRAFAEAIERDPALVSRDGRAAAQLCAHWLGAHRLPEALAAAVAAGIEAEEVYAFTEASHHFLRALDLWGRVDDPEAAAGMDEPALEARAAEAASLGDDGTLALQLVRRAIERVDPVQDPYRAALLRDRLAHYLWLFAGDDESAQRTYQEAVDLLPTDPPRPELARVLASLAQIHMLRGRTTESMERAEQALAVAREVGAGAAEALALNTLGSTLAFLGDRERAIALLRESLDRSGAIGEMDTMSRAYVNLAEVLDQDCRLEESAALSLEGAQRAGAVGMRDSRLLLLGEAATRAFKLGRLDDADAYTLEAAGAAAVARAARAVRGARPRGGAARPCRRGGGADPRGGGGAAAHAGHVDRAARERARGVRAAPGATRRGVGARRGGAGPPRRGRVRRLHGAPACAHGAGGRDACRAGARGRRRVRRAGGGRPRAAPAGADEPPAGPGRVARRAAARGARPPPGVCGRVCPRRRRRHRG